MSSQGQRPKGTKQSITYSNAQVAGARAIAHRKLTESERARAICGLPITPRQITAVELARKQVRFFQKRVTDIAFVKSMTSDPIPIGVNPMKWWRDTHLISARKQLVSLAQQFAANAPTEPTNAAPSVAATEWLRSRLTPALSPINALHTHYSQVLPRACQEVAALALRLRGSEQNSELIQGIDCLLECVLGPLVRHHPASKSAWKGAVSPRNLDTLYCLVGDVLRTLDDVISHQRERLQMLLLIERPGWVKALFEFAVWFLDTDTDVGVLAYWPFVRQGRLNILRNLCRILWNGLLHWPCTLPPYTRASFVRLAPVSATLTLVRCRLMYESLAPYPNPDWLNLLGVWVETKSEVDTVTVGAEVLVPLFEHLERTDTKHFQAACAMTRRVVAANAANSLTPDASCRLLVFMTSILCNIHRNIRQACHNKMLVESSLWYTLVCCLEEAVRLANRLMSICQTVSTLDEIAFVKLSHACCDMMGTFSPRTLVKPEAVEADVDEDEAPLARNIVAWLLHLPLPQPQYARLFAAVRTRLDQNAPEKTPALLRMAHSLANHDERIKANAIDLSYAIAEDNTDVRAYIVYLQGEQAGHASAANAAPAVLQDEETARSCFDSDEDDADYVYEGVSDSEDDVTSDEEDAMDVTEATDMYEASKCAPSEQELDQLRKRMRRVPVEASSSDSEEDADETAHTHKKARRQADEKEQPDDQADEDVQVVRLVLSAVTCVDDASVVFNADHAAGLRIGPSDLVPGHSGLFARGSMAKDSTVTWYTGQIYVPTGTTANRRQQACLNGDAWQSSAPASSTAAAASVAPASSADYFFEVVGEEDGRIKYIIDGFIPDVKFGGTSRCAGTYLNHHSTRANTHFRVRKVCSQRGILVYRVAIMTLRDIAAGEELLIDYGPAFTAKLRASGHLRE
jgi:hypothetical protein